VATVILVLGMSMTDFFDFIMDFQFNKVDRSEVHVDFVSERPPSAVLEVSRLPGVREAEGILQYAFEFQNGWRKKTVAVIGLPEGCELYRIYDPSGRAITVPADGFVVPDRLMKELGLALGQRVRVDPYVKGKEERTGRVRAVAEEYIGLVAYASRRYVCELLGEPDMVNGVLLGVERGALPALLSRLDDVPAVTGVTSRGRMLESFQESVAALTAIMTTVWTLFAGVTAFAVIYNSSIINISEREREFACLEAIGWEPEDVAEMATNDIAALGLVGIALGLPAGKLLCNALAKVYETDLYKLPSVVAPRTYLVAAVLIMVFMGLTRHICRRRVERINIVTALKTRE